MLIRRFLSKRFVADLVVTGLLAAAFCWQATAVNAQELGRVWVDASGLHSIQATLVRVEQQSVVLLRADGGTVTLPLHQLSQQDQDYVTSYQDRLGAHNSLRMLAPPEPNITPLEPLKLPEALFTAPENMPLEFGPALNTVANAELPESLPADRSRWSFGCQKVRIEMDKIDFSNDQISRPIPILTKDRFDTRVTSVIVSASNHIRLASDTSRQQVLRFDLKNKRRVVSMQHDQMLRLLDHDHDQQRSLMLVDHGPIGEGGKLGFAEGWDRDNLQMHTLRALPTVDAMQTPPKVRWARLVDSQHAVVAVDSSIVMWNLISGEPIYRINGIDARSTPAISGGHRYLAIPGHGKVDLHDTTTGKLLGRIKIEPKVPAVSFSPYGDTLAISTSRRIRVWNLPGAALDYDVLARESLGRKQVAWVSHDTLLTSSGVLVSLPLGLPVWKYDTTACEIAAMGEHIAIVRHNPVAQLVTVALPHPAAQRVIEHLRSPQADVDESTWRVAGRSDWDGAQWVDRDLRISRAPSRRR